jgi:hypothetical protein
MMKSELSQYDSADEADEREKRETEKNSKFRKEQQTMSPRNVKPQSQSSFNSAIDQVNHRERVKTILKDKRELARKIHNIAYTDFFSSKFELKQIDAEL